MKISGKQIINVVSKVVREQEERKRFGGKPSDKPEKERRRRKDMEKEFSSSSAPGHHIFRKCVDDGDPNTILTAIPGPEVAFFIEHAPGWDGYGNGGSSQLGYDSWDNSGTLFSSISTNWSIGEVRNITINGIPQGCHEYAGNSSTNFIPLFHGSTLDPITQQPIPADVTVSSNLGNCSGCMYGSVDPLWPGDMDDAILDDSEDISEGHTKNRIKNILKDFY